MNAKARTREARKRNVEKVRMGKKEDCSRADKWQKWWQHNCESSHENIPSWKLEHKKEKQVNEKQDKGDWET